MLDRASTFADPEIVRLLKTRLVPVAIDQASQRRQKDTEGEFYRKIAGQGPRNDFESTTQGFYIATASGKLLLYNNNRDPEKVRRLINEKLKEFESLPASESTIAGDDATTVDQRYAMTLPEGAMAVRVHAKILGGYEPTTDRWQAIFQSALSRDNLWVSTDEHRVLARGEFPDSLQQRIARFHLVDNTRGEPLMWNAKQIRELHMEIVDGQITGHARMEAKVNERWPRGYDAKIRGAIEVRDGVVVRFDLVSLGQAWGDGPYTRGAPDGKFPLAVSFSLADGTDVADRIPPQAARGWLEGYMPRVKSKN